MTRMVKLIVPEAPVTAPAAPFGYRQKDGRGLRLGILDNGKSNANHLLRFVLEAVQAALPVATVVSLQKPRPSMRAPAELLDQLAREADCVISGSGD